MKKFIFWALMLIGSLTGVIGILLVSGSREFVFNGVCGLDGFFLSTGLLTPFVLFCIIAVIAIGFLACEAYHKD